jgi:hypothetical protein
MIVLLLSLVEWRGRNALGIVWNWYGKVKP